MRFVLAALLILTACGPIAEGESLHDPNPTVSTVVNQDGFWYRCERGVNPEGLGVCEEIPAQ